MGQASSQGRGVYSPVGGRLNLPPCLHGDGRKLALDEACGLVRAKDGSKQGISHPKVGEPKVPARIFCERALESVPGLRELTLQFEYGHRRRDVGPPPLEFALGLVGNAGGFP